MTKIEIMFREWQQNNMRASLVTQRDQRIDFGRAPGGDVAREQRGEDHTKRYDANCDRIR